MRTGATRLIGVMVLVIAAAAAGGRSRTNASAQEPAAQPPSGSNAGKDPRVGLKAGFRNAGQASRHIQLVASQPKPPGFFDPKAPAGDPTPPEKPSTSKNGDLDDEPAPDAQPSATSQRSELGFANSDLAFKGEHLFVGNFNGFNTYDIEDPRRVKLMASVVCPGGQGDLSVYRNLLIMSVEETRGRIDCGTQGVQGSVSNERFRGVRIFDITDPQKPKQIAAIQSCRGSHTHTLVVDPDDTANIYVYGSGTGTVRSAQELAGCSGKNPKEDPDTALYSIDVIQIPLAAPASARIVNRPRIFADPTTGAIAGLWPGGDHGPGGQRSRATNRCHDITVFPEKGLAAGACAGNGILLDISDPVHPVRLDAVVDKNFGFWHSATFNNDATKVIYTDEWGGGTRPRCRPNDPPTWGANAIFDIVDRKLRFGGYYKLPAPQTEQENCVAHNGSIVPVPGRDIMVQAWYQGGLTVFDFTDSTRPFEIAFFDRGPLDARNLITGGYWSTYWYNGHIYGSEIARGVDVFRLSPSEHLSQNEIEAAGQVRLPEFNAQQQPLIVWPATSAVARAYIDQLTRTKQIDPERARSIEVALQRAERVRPGGAGADSVAQQLGGIAEQLVQDAGRASGREATRLRALSENLKNRASALR